MHLSSLSKSNKLLTKISYLKRDSFDLIISATVQFNIKGEEVAPKSTDLNLQTEIGLFGSLILSLKKKQVKFLSLDFKTMRKKALEISNVNRFL